MVTTKGEHDLRSLKLKPKYKHIKNMEKKSRRPMWISKAQVEV